VEREVFRRFYDATVIPARDKICEGKEGVKCIDNFEGVYEEYLNQKTLLKLLLKKDMIEEVKDTKKGEKTYRLDRHKVSACITIAIMKTRLISDTRVEDKNNDEYSLRISNRMNEQLAFYCGMSNLIAFMADDSDDDTSLLSENTFYFPETNNSVERLDRDNQKIGMQDYRDSIIRALFYSNTMSGDQTLMLSNIFFLLEAYHNKTCELNRIKNQI